MNHKSNENQAVSANQLNFDEVYQKYYSVILNYIKFKINHIEDAEELTSEVFVKVFKHLNEYKPEISTINTWLHNIANNTIIDFFRTNHRDKYINVSDFADAETGKEVFQFVGDNSANLSIENKELSNSIKNALLTLKPKYKRIAILYFIQDKPYNEIAELCEIPLGSVKGMIFRVREMLQTKLKTEYSTL